LKLENLYKKCQNTSQQIMIYFYIADLAGLGGQVEGEKTEYAVNCSRQSYGHTFVFSSKLYLADLDLTQEYLDSFRPKAYLKTRIR